MISEPRRAASPDSTSREVVEFDRLELVEARVPQVESFRSAIGSRVERQVLYVRWKCPDGSWGIGECSCRPDPFYSAEFNSGVVELLRSQVVPRVESEGTLGDLRKLLDRIRGWPFARAAVLDAALDLVRRRGGSDYMDAVPVQTRDVPAGVSLGLFETADAAVERVGRSRDAGYRRVKMKVRPDMDLEPLRAVRATYPDAVLAFDANGSCEASDIPGFVRALADLAPVMVEQPFPASRLDWCVEAKDHCPGLRICLDESIEDVGNLEVALQLGAIDELNVKPGRVGGQAAALELVERCEKADLPAWVGGMFETGVGRAANLRVAARVRGAVAHDLSPSRRYFATDVVRDPLEMRADGTIELGDERPVDLDEETLDRLTGQRWELANR